MKSGQGQFTLGSLMIAIAVFAVALAYPGLTARLLIGAFAEVRLMLVLVVFVTVTLVLFNYLVLSPCHWLLAVIERRLGARLDDGREP